MNLSKSEGESGPERESSLAGTASTVGFKSSSIRLFEPTCFERSAIPMSKLVTDCGTRGSQLAIGRLNSLLSKTSDLSDLKWLLPEF